MRYWKKRPVIVRAEKFTWANLPGLAEKLGHVVPDLVELNKQAVVDLKDATVAVETLEGTMKLELNDYLVVGSHGELYPVKPEIFEHVYELVADPVKR